MKPVCDECRKKKIKCNRLQPCDKCVKSFSENKCTYVVPLEPQPTIPTLFVPEEQPNRSQLLKNYVDKKSLIPKKRVYEQFEQSQSYFDDILTQLPQGELLDAIHLCATQYLTTHGIDAFNLFDGSALMAMGVAAQEFIRKNLEFLENIIPEPNSISKDISEDDLESLGWETDEDDSFY